MREFTYRPAQLSPHDGDADAALIRSLLKSLREHDAYTFRHSVRTVRMSVLLGKVCGVAGDRLRALRHGALVHDIGKVFIPGDVLHKPGRLTGAEWEAVRRHPEDGARLLRGLPVADERVARVVAEHHERWDGRGYPAGLRGEEIDLNARVVAVADAFDAMTSRRPYRRAVKYDAATAELESCAGTQFDPAVVGKFLRVPRAQLEEIIGYFAVGRHVEDGGGT
ncbi:MAG TPA: HD-GYP domain-containing protein [Pyrinomonadaceae bacterium]|jgi:putative nucleotidyltransferase with HDIG domain|nr:HD-GYP domain-containing protein [Pyrinomonadaceae bacterium]